MTVVTDLSDPKSLIPQGQLVTCLGYNLICVHSLTHTNTQTHTVEGDTTVSEWTSAKQRNLTAKTDQLPYVLSGFSESFWR